MKLTTMISGLMAGLLLTTQLSAQPPARPQGQQAQQGQQGQGQERTVVGFIARLRSMDANKDGKISKDELPERMQSILARVDSNKDNAIDDSELKALKLDLLNLVTVANVLREMLSRVIVLKVNGRQALVDKAVNRGKVVNPVDVPPDLETLEIGHRVNALRGLVVRVAVPVKVDNPASREQLEAYPHCQSSWS